MKKSPIEFQAHPPERRRRSGSVVCCCGCCCCCCLHSLGSLIGATMVAARSPKPPKITDPAAANPQINTHLGTSVYRKSLGALILLTALPFYGELSGVLLALLLGLPLIQLAASLISIIVLLFSKSPEKPAAMKQVWAITLWTFLGGLIGIGIMMGGIGFLK